MFTKQLCLFCLNSALKKCRISCETSQHSVNQSIREYSSKKSKANIKDTGKITVTAKNDFVTHHLNSSIATHLRRQQKIQNCLQEEERQEQYEASQKKMKFNQSNAWRQNQSHYKSDKNSCHHNNSHKDGPNQVNSDNFKRISDKNPNERRVSKIDIDEGEDDFNSDEYGIEELESPNWDEINLPLINKDFRIVSEMTLNRNTAEIEEFRKVSQIKVSSNVEKPLFKFNELNDQSKDIVNVLERNGFIDCTPIQAQSIAIALSGANMLAVSQSGTGKTLAMILSAIIHIMNQPSAKSRDGPIGVILAPTSEMAEQIRQIAQDFCQETGINCTILAESRRQSNYKLSEAGQLLIASPDILYEALRTKSMDLEKCSHFALYDADQMIEMCLDEEIEQIASQIRPDSQRVIWSKSCNGDLKDLAMNILNDYVHLNVGSTAVNVNIAQKIKQVVKMCDDVSKIDVLYEILDSLEMKTGNQKLLIFSETPKEADKIAKLLQKRGYPAESLHNGKSSMQQNEIVTAFQNDSIQLLTLTDVAAKNRTFQRVSIVIHFDMPFSIVEYANRVNQTGRSDEIGNSYAIVTENDGHLADDLIAILQQTNQIIEPALFILKAANVDSDDEISYAIPKGRGFQMYTIDKSKK